MERLSMQWRPCGAPLDAIRKPLAVLFPWVWAGDAYVVKYVALLHSFGFDVLLVSWSYAAMWVPIWARHMAWRVIEAVGKDLQQAGERPVVFYAFSGAAKGVFSSVLSLLARQHPLSQQQAGIAAAVLRCSVGCVYDSCPVDFTSEAGKKLLAPQIYTSSGSSSTTTTTISGSSSRSRAAASAARLARSAATFATGLGCDVTAGAMDFFLLEWFEQDRQTMWTALENSPVRGPVLLLYSRSDELADAAQISLLAGSLRLKGHAVLEQTWQDSPHCGHYRLHPEQYRECVGWLLSQALQEWSARSSRAREGRKWVDSWQQQQTQQVQHTQQTQHLKNNAAHEDQQQQQYAGDSVHQLSNEQQQQQQQHQQQQLVMQPARGSYFPGGKRKQQEARVASSQHSSCSASSSSSSCGAACSAGSHMPSAGTQNSSSSRCSHGGGSSRVGAAQQAVIGTTGCCCSGNVLAAVTAAAVADAASADISQAMRNCSVADSSRHDASSGSSRIGSVSAGAAHKRQHQVPQLQQQQQASRDLTPLVLLSHAAAAGSSNHRSTSGRRTQGGSSSSSVRSAPAAGVGGIAASISTCCGCAASECRCAETLAAASGEIVCSDSTTLSHSLRCMASTYMNSQRQHQQDQRQRQLQQARFHSSGSSSSCSSLVQDWNSSGSSSKPREKVAGGSFSDNWLQQQEHAMLLLQQQQQEQPFVQRVVSRLRSRL